MKFLLILAVLACASAQEKSAQSQPAEPDDIQELGRNLAEGGNSPADYIRVLEAHLAKYPQTKHRAEIERVLTKSALEAKDDPRIILYGERVLAREPDDVQLLDRVARAYVMKGDEASARKGLEWARKYELAVADRRKEPPPGRLSAGQWSDELDRAHARALMLQARGTGTIGEKTEAIALAKRGFEAYPTSEGAREWAKWLAATGDNAAAVEHLADAFTLEDARNTDSDRASDRRRMGELYSKLNGSEKGLGDTILRSYDRMSSLSADRAAHLKALDPNAEAGSILDFTLPGANGKDLKLASLKGKTLVLDFWATWCVPCKAQRPLYQHVEEKFKNQPNVVFLSVNTDEERASVPGFLKEQKWTNAVYYEGGLAEYLKVSSIPTTLIVDKTGQVASRMNGFIPDLFEAQLAERIQDTLR